MMIAGISLAILLSSHANAAQRLTVLQSRLLGLPNHFIVKVEDFKPDGLLTPKSVKTFVETQLMKHGINLVKDTNKPPLAKIIVTIKQKSDKDRKDQVYLIDLNIYNLTVIKTRYKLRKGTIWMMGSLRVVPGKDFPRDVEKKIGKLVKYFVNDYYKANPYQKKHSSSLKPKETE